MSERARVFRSSFYGRLMVGGYLLAPVALGVLVVILKILGGRPPSGVLSLLLTLSVVMVVAASLLWWSDRFVIPATALAVLLSLLAFVLGGFGFSHPDSFFDFVTSVVTVIGPIVAVVAGVRVLGARRRHRLDPARPEQRRFVRIGLVVLVLLTAVSGTLTFARQSSIDAPKGSFVVEMYDDRFDPADFSLEPGPHKVFLVNRDSYAHTFAVGDTDDYVGPRANRLITLMIPAEQDRMDLSCSVTGHDDMTGTIEVDA